MKLLEIPLVDIDEQDGIILPPIPRELLDKYGEVGIRQVGNLLVVEKIEGRIKSEVTFTLRNSEGEITSHRTINTICDVGHEWIADKVSHNNEEQMLWMAIGDTSGGKTAASTTLQNELIRRSSSFEHLAGADAKKVRYVGYYEAGVATTTLKEAALFNDATAGTILAYTEFSQVKAADEDLTITWDIEY